MAVELIVRPDPVAAVVAALNARLAEAGQTGVKAYGQTPTPRPQKFVKVFRVGGPITNVVIDNAMIRLEAWGPTDQQSLALANAAAAIVNTLGDVGRVGNVGIYRVTEFSGPANSPDPASHTPRHTWTVEVKCRAVTPTPTSA